MTPASERAKEAVRWKSFLGGHHFIDLPSDCTPFKADQKGWYQYAAMMSTLNITGKKEKVLGKYMRQHLGPAFCPTLRSLPPT